MNIITVNKKMPATIWPKSGNHATPTLMPKFLLYSCLCCAHGCGICPAPCVLRLCTVVFARKCRLSACARMYNAANIIFIMWNSISGLDAWYHFRFNISYGVTVMMRGHQKKNSGNFLRGREGEGQKQFWRGRPIFEVLSIFQVVFIF